MKQPRKSWNDLESSNGIFFFLRQLESIWHSPNLTCKVRASHSNFVQRLPQACRILKKHIHGTDVTNRWLVDVLPTPLSRQVSKPLAQKRWVLLKRSRSELTSTSTHLERRGKFRKRKPMYDVWSRQASRHHQKLRRLRTFPAESSL